MDARDADAVAEFGKMVIGTLKDEAIERFELLAAGKSAANDMRGIQQELSNLTEEQKNKIKDILVFSVLSGIHGFLSKAIEGHDQKSGKGFKFSFNGEDVVMLSDGLLGELWGWDQTFSKYPSQEALSREYNKKYGFGKRR